ncbi:hypothetical protein I6F14_23565 [Bradyrhizobium sp. IC3069]|uniref:hypothetical protein n=1 Tax=unclassified Bradyrhizobium TaxID=2631580 RepID=UPI001CD3E5CA|nr:MULTISPECIES: hypothetical protein [unclassified Bradyrhizobium]MCA1363388.1 hypothetical protein [Bradyrhizobium sp. IC4059]MCA1520926.1 hypothetical protein [Bradyrhizobium sp. IC3069]
MREGSHFDGHQTTGYNLHKNITKLEVSNRTVPMRVTESLFPDAIGAGRTSAGMSIVINLCGAGFAGADPSSVVTLARQCSIPLPHLR